MGRPELADSKRSLVPSSVSWIHKQVLQDGGPSMPGQPLCLCQPMSPGTTQGEALGDWRRGRW